MAFDSDPILAMSHRRLSSDHKNLFFRSQDILFASWFSLSTSRSSQSEVKDTLGSGKMPWQFLTMASPPSSFPFPPFSLSASSSFPHLDITTSVLVILWRHVLFFVFSCARFDSFRYFFGHGRTWTGMDRQVMERLGRGGEVF